MVMFWEWRDKSDAIGFFKTALKEEDKELQGVFNHAFNRTFNTTGKWFTHREFERQQYSTSSAVNYVCQQASIQISRTGDTLKDSNIARMTGYALAYFIAAIECGVTLPDYDGKQQKIVLDCALEISNKLKVFDTHHIGMIHILTIIERIRKAHRYSNRYVNRILTAIEKIFK